MADLCVVPLGQGTSVSKHVAKCIELLQKRENLICVTHAYGTNVEGDLEEVTDAIRECIGEFLMLIGLTD